MNVFVAPYLAQLKTRHGLFISMPFGLFLPPFMALMVPGYKVIISDQVY